MAKQYPPTVYAWIAGLPGVVEVRPAVVTVGETGTAAGKGAEVYDDAAWYRREFDAPEGCRNPGRYTQEIVYVRGLVPVVCTREKVCFTVAGDAREWYMAGGYYKPKGSFPSRQPVEPNEYNPFGNAFMLCPWYFTDGSKVDDGERKPYRRVPLKVETRNDVPLVARVSMNVRVTDPAKVIAYAKTRAVDWGFPADHSWALGEAIYETLVLNGGVAPVDVGLEIEEREHTVEDCTHAS